MPDTTCLDLKTSELGVSSTISGLSMLQVVSKREYNDLITVIGDVRNEVLTPDFIRNSLNITKRECNSRIGVLMSLDLVNMIDNQYYFTTLGRKAYESLKMIEDAIKCMGLA